MPGGRGGGIPWLSFLKVGSDFLDDLIQIALLEQCKQRLLVSHTWPAPGAGFTDFPTVFLPFHEERRERPVLLQRKHIHFPSVPVDPAIHSEW